MKKICMICIASIAFANVNLSTCKGCHGQRFEKKALGRSDIVRDMNSTSIYNTLVSFKTGTDPAGAIMKAQVYKYNKKDLKTISKDIKKIK